MSRSLFLSTARQVLLLSAALVALGTGPAARAESVVVQVLEGTSRLGAGQTRELQQTAEAVLTELSSLTRQKPGPLSAAAKKAGCAQDVACLVALAKAAGTEHALVLRGRQNGSRLYLSGAWVDAVQEKLTSRPEREVESFGSGVRGLVPELLPAYARRGFGALTVAAEPGTVVKVDGKKVAVMPLDAPLVLPAGTYGVDLVTPSGNSVLRRERVKEGERGSVVLDMEAARRLSGGSRGNGLTWTSYGLWTASAVAIASAFVAGSIAKDAEGELRSCPPTNRDCTSFEEAQRLEQRSAKYTRNANALLVTGGGLGAAGVVLFGLSRWTRDSVPEASGSGSP